MSVAKIAISLDRVLLKKLDELIDQEKYQTRSQAIQNVIQEKIARLEHARLARECEKLDVMFEQNIADEGLLTDKETWSEF